MGQLDQSENMCHKGGEICQSCEYCKSETSPEIECNFLLDILALASVMESLMMSDCNVELFDFHSQVLRFESRL